MTDTPETPNPPKSRAFGLPLMIAAWAPFFIFSLVHRMPVGPIHNDVQAAHAAKAWSAGALALADAAGRVGSPGGVVILNALEFPSRAPLFLAAAGEVLFFFALLGLGRAMGSAVWGWAVAAIGLCAAQLINTTATAQFQFAIGGALAAFFTLAVLRATAPGAQRKRALLLPGIVSGALGLTLSPVSGGFGLALALPSMVKRRRGPDEPPSDGSPAHGGRIAFGLLYAAASVAILLLLVKNPAAESPLGFLNTADLGVGAIHLTAALGVGILTAPIGVWTAVLAAAALLPLKAGVITAIALVYVLIFSRDDRARFSAALCLGVGALQVSGLGVQTGSFMRIGFQALFWSGALSLLARTGLGLSQGVASAEPASATPRARQVSWALFAAFAALTAHWTFDSATIRREANLKKSRYVADILMTLDWVAAQNTASAPVALLNAPGSSQSQLDLIAQAQALRTGELKSTTRIRALKNAPAPAFVITNQEAPAVKKAFDPLFKGEVHQETTSKITVAAIQAKTSPDPAGKAQPRAKEPAKAAKPAPIVIMPGNVAIKGGTPGPKAEQITYRGLFTHGFITYPIKVPAGRVAFEIEAWGTSYQNVGPKFQISLDHVQKSVVEVKSSKPQVFNFEHTFTKSGMVNLRIRFLNDNQGSEGGQKRDRNLFIGKVVARPLP